MADGVGHVTLDRPQAINALSYEMVQGLTAVFDAWREDGEVSLVVLDGAGDRGFCAGGDIRELWGYATDGGHAEAQAFFRTEYRLDAAIDTAQACFVRDLPWGLETRIGEQGLSLSGGQRQRLAVARAVLARPKVLVLDDTLSALDVHTERLVEDALARVLGRTTGIVVAHRASTVLLADKVALLADGTITHVGRHRDLLAQVPAYRELLAAEPAEVGAS